jgi:hypothetical protein
MAVSKASKDWNGGGFTGRRRTTAIPAAQGAVVEECAVDACGKPAGRAPVPGMVRVRGGRDGAPAHWYCPGRCAAIARARADLRQAGARTGEEGS